MVIYVLCWTYIAFLIERVVLFLYPSSFPIDSILEASILEGVIMEVFSCLLDKFPVFESYFLLIELFLLSI